MAKGAGFPQKKHGVKKPAVNAKPFPKTGRNAAVADGGRKTHLPANGGRKTRTIDGTKSSRGTQRIVMPQGYSAS